MTVHVNRSVPVGVSRLRLGVTHTQYSLDSANASPQAVRRAKRLLSAVCRYQNQHIMGWGADNPEPSPGVYNWESLDRRINLIRSMHATPVITLCAAPDWMKGGQPGKTDWSKIEVAPLPSHYADFANLAKKVAQRYPDVRYFQVWNEFKGLWDPAANNWDYRAYTALYNRVYDALKSVNPGNKVGGPYLVIEGTGSNKGGWAAESPVRARQWEVIDYWLRNKHGADFIVLDRGITDFHDSHSYTPAEIMALTHTFGDVARQIRARTTLPLWWAEYYGGTGDPDFVAANYASIYLHMAKAGVPQTGLLWNPLQDGEVGHFLVDDIRRPGGGEATPHYRVFAAFQNDFGPGTTLYRASSSAPDVEVLASAKKTLLINKRPIPVQVLVDGRRLTLARYEVRLLSAAPATAR